jgi:hypothetical protein
MKIYVPFVDVTDARTVPAKMPKSARFDGGRP